MASGSSRFEPRRKTRQSFVAQIFQLPAESLATSATSNGSSESAKLPCLPRRFDPILPDRPNRGTVVDSGTGFAVLTTSIEDCLKSLFERLDAKISFPVTNKVTVIKRTIVLNDNFYSQTGHKSEPSTGSAMNNIQPVSGFDPLSQLQNSHAYSSYQRQRTMTLGDMLLENRIVFLQGEIHTGNANELIMKLLYLQSENKKKDINFYLNSPGGDVIATLAIYDVMQIISCPVATYCVGQAASGGAVLLAGGTKGKRYCLPNSRVMIHQPHGGVSGQVSDIEIQANEILRNREVLNEVLAKHTGQTIEQIEKDTGRDFFLTAEQAKDYGLVDQLTARPDASEDDD